VRVQVTIPAIVSHARSFGRPRCRIRFLGIRASTHHALQPCRWAAEEGAGDQRQSPYRVLDSCAQIDQSYHANCSGLGFDEAVAAAVV